MKEKILTHLKSKLTGVQESFLVGIAENFSKTITDEASIETTITQPVLDAIKLSAQMLQVEGDRRATEATKSAVKNFIDKHGLDENGKPKGKPDKTEPDGGGGGNPDVPAWFKSFADKIDRELQESKQKLTAIEQAKTHEVLSGKVKASLKEKGIPEWFSNPLLRNLTVESEDKIDQLVTQIEADFGVARQASAEQGVVIAVPPRPEGATEAGAEIGKKLAEKRNAETGEKGKLK